MFTRTHNAQVFESELQSYTSPPGRRNTNYWLFQSYGELANAVDVFGSGVCSYVAPTPCKKVFLCV